MNKSGEERKCESKRERGKVYGQGERVRGTIKLQNFSNFII